MALDKWLIRTSVGLLGTVGEGGLSCPSRTHVCQVKGREVEQKEREFE